MSRAIAASLQAGMSIIEMMVATAISLIGVLVIFQVFAVNEDIRRSTTTGSDEQISGLVALTMLERDLRTAGNGINELTLIGCRMEAFDNQRTPAIVPFYPLVPVHIVANAGATPDLIRVIYGQPRNTTASLRLTTGMSDPLDAFTLTTRYGFEVGDLLVATQTVRSVPLSSRCTMAEVSSLPAAFPQDVAWAVGTINAPDGTRTSRFNNPAGTPLLFGTSAKLANLGPLPLAGRWPVRNEWSVETTAMVAANNFKLNVANLWAQIASPQPIAEQIVQLKAEYGMDDGVSNNTVPPRAFVPDDNVVDRFVSTSPADVAPVPPDTQPMPDQAAWQRVKVVRLAIVSRSVHQVEPTGGKGTACDATPDFDASLAAATYPVRWARGPDAPAGRPIDVRSSADWRCYKYKVYETTVPLRNVLWRQP
jgi:type IV pilus assembly protein PilW